MINTDPPARISLRKAASSLLMSSKCRPVVGSSKMNSVLLLVSFARYDASLILWASPPESVVADWPSRRELRDAEVPAGYTLFGLYTGIPLTERTSAYNMVLPDRITIFQGPLCEAFDDPDDLREEIRATVIHEFAHFFGLSDDDLGRMDAT